MFGHAYSGDLEPLPPAPAVPSPSVSSRSLLRESARPAVSGSPCDCELHFCPAPAATSAALGQADFELRLYRHRDRRRDSPRRRVALLFQCSFPLGIPSSPSVELSENSRRSRSNLSTLPRKLRGSLASRSCRRKETLKKLHYWATDSMASKREQPRLMSRP